MARGSGSTFRYRNGLGSFFEFTLWYVVIAGVLYSFFVGLLATYAATVASEHPFSITEADFERGRQALADGFVFLQEVWAFFAARPVLALGLVLTGYLGYLVTRLDDQNVHRFRCARPRWQWLAVATGLCALGAFASTGFLQFGFQRGYIARSFVYAAAALFTVHFLGYTIIDDTANHGLDLEPWQHVGVDFLARASLLLVGFDGVFGLTTPGSVSRVALRLTPVALSVGYFGYIVGVDESRERYNLGRFGGGEQVRELAGGGSAQPNGGSATVTEDRDGSPFHPESPPDRNFDDVAGMSDLKERLRREVLEPLENPDRFRKYDLGTVNGVLLHGPPGTGKTYVSKALAGELGYSFIRATPTEITSKYVSEGAENVGELFEQARRAQPCMVFIDEFDAVAGSRDGEMTSSGRQMVNQLLEELSELNESDADVVVVAATNLIDEVDDAVTRPGRFDTTIEVPEPDAEGRVAVLRHHLERRGLDIRDVDWEEVAAATKGYSASQLSLIADNVVRELVETGSEVVDHDLVAETIAETEPETPTGAAADFLRPPPDEDFDDIAGMSDLKDRLRERVLQPLADAETYEEHGLSPVNGVLLYGPPGTGKTLVARAVAGELGYNYIDVAPSDVVSSYAGESSVNVRELFDVARSHQPCVVFVDEVDAIAPSRDGQMSQSQRQMVNQLLEELESIQGEEIAVFGATNLLERVDDAVKRSKRFDERIEVPRPDGDTRVAILRHHLDRRPQEVAPFDEDAVADRTEGFTGSDMELVAETAVRLALEREGDGNERTVVSETDVFAAIEDTPPSLD